ncbi:RDD family protein [Wolbachia endosymbiont of Mansonella ozzardi]|uniref:RDD family protein n=1 Tax=Wolbachia endosymbiont of Mansonella ozzardi TaxID=137464 RepID=UPI001CE04F3F|nr:RDD family protein [Wolbachia endosymbiont of Mansonella ozzardi]MCA4775017.1 RDD family protein [Wolbachia endosymbiont of Mansonella ozzardi]
MNTEISYAGILRRVLASVIDGVLWVTIVLVISFFLYLLHHSSTPYNDTGDTYKAAVRMTIAKVIVPVCMMFNMLMTTRLGDTPGKLLCGIYIKMQVHS